MFNRSQSVELLGSRIKYLSVVLWVVFYCYSVCLALIFQKVLLPLVPSLHGGGGLLANDAIYFDSVAMQMAESIRLLGWGAWTFFPAQGAAGNVAILGALYALFGHDPALIIPVNAGIHALGGTLIFLIICEISEKKDVGTVAGILTAGLFVVFPSALNWYGQIHKDGYAIAGSLLVFWAWLLAVNRQLDIRMWFFVLCFQLVGIVLLGIVRPYSLKLLFIAALGVLFVAVSMALIRRQFLRKIGVVLIFSASLILLAGGMKVADSLNAISVQAEQLEDMDDAGKIEGGEQAEKLKQIRALKALRKSIPAPTEVYANWSSNTWQWQNTLWVPDAVEGYIELIARTRAGLIEYGRTEGAKSMIDTDMAPRNVSEALMYVPRALQVALLAPFPGNWFSELSMTRLVAIGEMAIFYLCMPGLIFLLVYNRRPTVFLAFYFSLFFLIIFGFSTANLGTLYRLRYAYWMIVLSMGVLGWFIWFERIGMLKSILLPRIPQVAVPERVSEAPTPAKQGARKQLLGRGVWVMGLTFLCFLGFFVRDIVMANQFGLGVELDDFVVALMIPMFVVTVLSIPLGAAFTPIFLEAKEHQPSSAMAALVSDVSFRVSVVLLLICLVLVIAAPVFLPLLKSQQSSANDGQLELLLYLALPILIISGVLILGNAVLNAYGHVVLTSAAQLLVPIVAIFSLFVFGSGYGVIAVMLGMVFGQLLNLMVVQVYLRQYDLSLFPRLGAKNKDVLLSLGVQYLPLVVSALFVSLVTPVSTFLAMSLPRGSVSALNLGNKVVMFVTGLVGAAISSVMLPYFSTLVAKNQLVSARRELSFFMLSTTFVSVPISAGLFVLADPIVRFLFQRGSLDEDAVALVVRVMQYAVIQLPFFVSNALLLRFATATRHVMAICVTAILGLLVNVGLSMFLMEHMGVAGIALGSSVSMLLSTVLLVLVLVVYRHISVVDAVATMLNWLLFLTLLVSLHFQSYPGIGVTLVAYSILFGGYIRSLTEDSVGHAVLKD